MPTNQSLPNNPPTSPIPGAVYVDRSTNISWVWTGTFWLQATQGSQNYASQQTISMSIIPGYYEEPSPDSWVPHIGTQPPQNPLCGQIWVDTSSNPNPVSIWDCGSATFRPIQGTPGDVGGVLVVETLPTLGAYTGQLLVARSTNGLYRWQESDPVTTPRTGQWISIEGSANTYNME